MRSTISAKTSSTTWRTTKTVRLLLLRIRHFFNNFSDENLYLDDAVIFDDFEFDEEFVPEMAKADEYQSNNVHENSSTKSDEKDEESPSSPMSKRDRKLSENSEKSER